MPAASLGAVLAAYPLAARVGQVTVSCRQPPLRVPSAVLVAAGLVAGRQLFGSAARLAPVPADAAGVRALGSPWRRELYAAAPRCATCLVRGRPGGDVTGFCPVVASIRGFAQPNGMEDCGAGRGDPVAMSRSSPFPKLPKPGGAIVGSCPECIATGAHRGRIATGAHRGLVVSGHSGARAEPPGNPLLWRRTPGDVRVCDGKGPPFEGPRSPAHHRRAMPQGAH